MIKNKFNLTATRHQDKKQANNPFRVIGLFLILFLLVTSPLAFAQEQELQKTAEEAGLPRQTSIPILVGRTIRVFLGFAGLILVIFIIYGGIIWMTSEGNEEKIKKAKGLILNSVIGLGIIIVSYAITVFVIEALRDITSGGGGNIQP